jgi:hypothetical protein
MFKRMRLISSKYVIWLVCVQNDFIEFELKENWMRLNMKQKFSSFLLASNLENRNK